MRYDKKVEFLKDTASVYDPVTGNTGAGRVITGQKMCHVHDLSTQNRVEVYGRADIQAVTLHHLGRLVDAEFLRIGARIYRITVRRELGGRASYIAQEVKG